uniref:RanBP2-type domain-containing protein n=1 Tax=Hyaloperonospora arabidopsidis (strain Emoy2) TaxID=559515 RepID=M4BFL1_HYAAE
MDSSSGTDTDTLLGAKTVEAIQDNAEELVPSATIGPRPWECRMCTFLNEDGSASGCSVCRSKRPGLLRKTRKLSQWLSQPVDWTEKKQSENRIASTSARRDFVEVIDSSESGENDAAGVGTTSTNCDVTSCRRRKDSTICNLKAVKSKQELWANLYAPKTVDDLCVNKKKVQEISEWLHHNASPRPGVFQKRLLFLYGPPGSGKSTAVRRIALQLGILVKEWSDNSSAGKLDYARMLRDDFYMPQVSGVDDFSDFIHRSVTYAELPFATSRRMRFTGRKRRLASNQEAAYYREEPSASSGQLILIESWPQSWSSDLSLYEEKLRQIYQSVVSSADRFRYPAVCIYSDVQGSKLDVEHLSRKFSREVIHSPLTSVINVNAVTSTQMKKCLERVAAQEKCAFQVADIQKIIDCSGGDIRHALNMLQVSKYPGVKKLEMVLAPASKKGKRENMSTSPKTLSAITSSVRDPFLSDFHVVGKLLHGKMLQSKSGDKGKSKRKTYDIDDDQVLAASAMPMERVLGLVHENSIAYFSQVEDLSGALELMSFCEMMVAKSCNSVSISEAFKRSRDVTQAILLRAVAVTNKNPAPKKFRPITRPRTYTAKQRMVSRREEMVLVAREDDYGFRYACMGDVFAFEVEPYLKILDQVGGSTVRQVNGESTCVMDALSLRDTVDDEIENSDEGWP